MKETILFILIFAIRCTTAVGQKEIAIEEITNKCSTLDQISFRAPKEMDSDVLLICTLLHLQREIELSIFVNPSQNIDESHLKINGY